MALTLGTEVPSTPADGLVNTIWVPTIADITKPKADEINAGTDLPSLTGLAEEPLHSDTCLWAIEGANDRTIQTASIHKAAT